MSTPEQARAVAEFNQNAIQRWSTEQVPPPKRVEYFAAALSESIVPMVVKDVESATFAAEVSAARLDAIRLCKVHASQHGAVRGPKELALTPTHEFNLLMSLDSPWRVNHRGKNQMLPGDILFHDSDYPLELGMQGTSVGLSVSLPESWVRRWLPNPSAFSGRRVAAKSPWGSALSAYLAELSPELVNAPPLPLSVLADQVGSLLALAMSTNVIGNTPAPPATRSLHERIVNCIEQRCTDSNLTAPVLADALGISVRTLHRTLASSGDTFGVKLIEARVAAAERMLSSPSFNRVTTAEIGLRAGFQSASHFARAVRKRTGRTPRQLRPRRD